MAAETKKYITSDELKKHNKREDLWLSIQGKVYNVTDWAKQHPGGEVPLMNMAGEDVTDAFIAFHPGSAWKHLDRFFTGYHLQDFHVSEMSRDYRNLANHIAKSGLFENKGHGTIYYLCLVSVLLAACFYGVLRCDDFSIHMLSGAVLGFVWMQVAYLGHDSGHYCMMMNPRFNKVAQILTGNCLTGISIAWWKWTHNAHHIACNSLDYDPDLQHLPMLAVSTSLFKSLTSQFYGRKLEFDSVARFFISYQHLTYYPVMCVARVNLYLQTFLLLLSNRKVPDRALNILGIMVFWTWFPLLVASLPNWTERVLFVLASFCVCSIQHIQFTLNHFAANVYIGPPKSSEWLEKQTKGTIDISCPSWMDWFFGGLQFQLEHHLFPRLPRCQLRKISPIVEELCKKHNLPYRSLSFFEANKWTLRTLRAAALEARDFTVVPKNLLWEAVNTHG
ncbi:Fatty acid/sphingolipid desaturase [Perilla frutescens var. hirtella]|uniref:Fatty acid/sphingolipid desaturase n=1 Tax=Perilla frutescens var. hirtella TaxID=608512 RepID=A0AAD4IPN6_PERFH|nr:Fatty acid/sphingolipid desaturase [Perilla frutescens var. hirtella]KAH6767373.1 Fatty acid/sphingolipid desaturase [Perilla frutescens var. hirtella]KAH6812072.1 Fatty acid/sphingolipid desaturase [Perilla frutescens var. frutescens]KAH6813203.1 Fatty acid/sphingolipid desaturase [Perilla frutescens var. frutescens]UDV78670.1 fatty acid desaturase-like protein 1.4 [Perilla frutescens]